MTDYKQEIDRIIRENFYDDHEGCDDSCGKKADYTEIINDLTHLINKARIDLIDEVIVILDGQNVDIEATREHMLSKGADENQILNMEIEASDTEDLLNSIQDRIKELQSRGEE